MRFFAIGGRRRFNSGLTKMRTYYFDKKDGVPLRDTKGMDFPTRAAAIEHSRALATDLRAERTGDRNLYISVIDETGAEVHREPVHSSNPTKKP